MQVEKKEKGKVLVRTVCAYCGTRFFLINDSLPCCPKCKKTNKQEGKKQMFVDSETLMSAISDEED